MLPLEMFVQSLLPRELLATLSAFQHLDICSLHISVLAPQVSEQMLVGSRLVVAVITLLA